ncbi:hypothetical protein ACDW82_13855 [Alcaligenes faecalis]
MSNKKRSTYVLVQMALPRRNQIAHWSNGALKNTNANQAWT